MADEYHCSRNLKTLKILIDGSPYTYQSEIAEMFATFYSLHQIHSEGFLENFHQRLVSVKPKIFTTINAVNPKQIIKIKEAENYRQHMKSMETSEKLWSEMIEKVERQIIEWREKLDVVADRLKNSTQPAFHEIQECVINRLTSFSCAKHQGYVMDGFELDSEMASYLFLEPSDDGFEFNETTKPDYVIILNRVVENDDCADLEEKMTITDEVQETSEMKTKLTKY